MNGEQAKNDYLPRKTFFWIMGIFVIVFMSVIGYNVGKLDDVEDKYNHNFTTITNEMSAIQVDISWIKNKLDDI